MRPAPLGDDTRMSTPPPADRSRRAQLTRLAATPAVVTAGRVVGDLLRSLLVELGFLRADPRTGRLRLHRRHVLTAAAMPRRTLRRSLRHLAVAVPRAASRIERPSPQPTRSGGRTITSWDHHRSTDGVPSRHSD